MDLRYPTRYTRTTVSINVEDLDYCKKHGLKPTHLIRAAIRDHKVHTDAPDADHTMRELIRSRKAMLESRQKILALFEKELGEKNFLEIIQKL